MGIRRIKYNDYDFPGIYRGTVVFNVDPDIKGKLKIFVHGVYPTEYFTKHELLPWAQPAMSLFGGNWTNQTPDFYGNHLNDQVGWCTVPHQGKVAATGSQVFVFFENSDINKPVYFASAQSGKGWFSQHPNQHVFRTDNVHIRIDQNTKDPGSTCKFDTYNQQNNAASIHDGTKKEVQTRMDIQILANEMTAVNLQISGNVNTKIIGDWYVQHVGDKHQTHIGNYYAHHVGDSIIQVEGNYNYKLVGQNYNQYIQAYRTLTINGQSVTTITQNCWKTIYETYTKWIGSNSQTYVGGQCSYTVCQNDSRTSLADYTGDIAGNCNITINRNLKALIGMQGTGKDGNATITVAHDISCQSTEGNIDLHTAGQFELQDENGVITADGYKHIGTKGNIQITSTLGNIAIKTINNGTSKPGLCTQSYIIPWNPVFLSNVSIISMIWSDFDPTKAIFMNFKSMLQSLTSFSGLIDFIMTLPSTIIYDGLPTFFPCKMITQNPNKKGVNSVEWLARRI